MKDSVAVSNDLQLECSKRNAMLFVVFLLMYEICAYVANDMIMPGMIDVVRSFHEPDSRIASSLTAYILGGGSLQIILGPLSDRYGRRPIMLFGVTLFLICTLLIAQVHSMDHFVISRFFQGMGLCFISVIGYATLQEIFTEMYAVRLVSIMNNITVAAPLAGPLLGSIVIHNYGWRAVFNIIALPAAISLIGIWLFMPESVGAKRSDGNFINSTSLHPRVIKNNYLALLKNRKFILGSLALGFATVPIIGWIGTSPLILMEHGHQSVIQYGLWQIPIFIFAIVGNVIMRYYTYRIPLQQITYLGSWCIFISLLVMAGLTLIMRNHYLAIIIGMSLYSLGLGFTSAPLNRLTLFSTLVPKGTASALISLFVMGLTGVGNQVSGWVYASQNNLHFTLFCAVAGTLYFILYRLI